MLWREFKIPGTQSAHLLEVHILKQTITIKGGIVDKTEDHIERNRQVVTRYERRYKSVSDFVQVQTSQIKLQDLLSSPIVEKNSDEIKIETLRESKYKRK